MALFSLSAVFAEGGSGGKWVLVETRINPDNHPLISYSESRRYGGSFDNITLTETRFTRHWYRIKRAYKKYPDRVNDVITEFNIDKPPEELIPGQPFILKVTGELVVRKRERTSDYLGTSFKFTGSKGVFLQGTDGPGKIRKVNDQVIFFEVSENEPTGSLSYTFVLDEALAEDPDFDEIIITADMVGYKVEWFYRRAGEEGDELELPEWAKKFEEYQKSAEEIYVPSWLDWIKPKKKIRSRGVIIEPKGEIYVWDATFKKMRGPLRSEGPIYGGDIIFTGPDSSIRVVFSNTEGRQDTITVGRDTLLEVPKTLEPSEYPSIWSLYSGIVKIKRAVLKEAPDPDMVNPFIVRTPTLVAGSRGTEFTMQYDPGRDISTVHLIEGELNTFNLVTNGSGIDVLTVGNSLKIRGDGSEDISALSQQEWDSLNGQYGFEDSQPLSEEEFDKLYEGLNNKGSIEETAPNENEQAVNVEKTADGGGGSGSAFNLIGIFIIIIIAALVLLRVRKKQSI